MWSCSSDHGYESISCIDLCRFQGISKHYLALQYAWQSETGCVGKRRSGLCLCLTAWMLTIYYRGRGHIVNEKAHVHFFDPPHPPRLKDPGFESTHLARSIGGVRWQYGGGYPLKNPCVCSLIELNPLNRLFTIYIYHFAIRPHQSIGLNEYSPNPGSFFWGGVHTKSVVPYGAPWRT
jgi:hypothetical protein